MLYCMDNICTKLYTKTYASDIPNGRVLLYRKKKRKSQYKNRRGIEKKNYFNLLLSQYFPVYRLWISKEHQKISQFGDRNSLVRKNKQESVLFDSLWAKNKQKCICIICFCSKPPQGLFVYCLDCGENNLI